MVKLTFSASEIKAIAGLLQGSKESKNFPEAQYIRLGVCEKDDTTYLMASTDQPSFLMDIYYPLSNADGSVEVNAVTDNYQEWVLKTDSLLHALGSFGSQEITLRMEDNGNVQLSCGQNVLTLEGKATGCSWVWNKLDGPSLSSQDLIRGLQPALDLARTRGNDLERSGVHMAMDANGLRIEGSTPLAMALTQYDEKVWTKAPTQSYSHVLTVDSVSHLLKALNMLGAETTRMGICSDRIFLQSGPVTICISLQNVNYLDTLEYRECQYEQAFQVQRLQLLQALRSLKAIGEQRFQLAMKGNTVTLSQVSGTEAASLSHLEAIPTTLSSEAPTHEYPIAPLISALRGQDDQVNCLLHHRSEQSLCVECGNILAWIK